MTGIAFIDTETTGLDVDRHSIWEVALITPNGDEHVWQFPVDESTADPFALNIGHYWDRRWNTVDDIPWIDAIYNAHQSSSRRKHFPDEGRAVAPSSAWCSYFRGLTAGLHLCGAVPSFDEERLRRLFVANGLIHRWHYHVIDVEALAVGHLYGRRSTPGGIGVAVPWNSNDLSRSVGVDPDEFDRHTALGDARWAKAIYEAVTG